MLRPLLGCILAICAAAAALPTARAQAPAGPSIRVLVVLPPGSTSDTVARLLAGALRERLDRPVIVDNRPGASGRVAVDALKAAAPDGNTLLFAPVFVPVVAPLVLKDLRYDPSKDLVPVAQVGRYEFAFAVDVRHPARTLGEFVAWAKANPASATVGNPASGSLPHFVAFALGRAAGTTFLHVPYKGPAQMEADLIGGQIAAGVGTVTDFAVLHRAGKLRVLAVASPARAALLPDVPTFREAGYPTVEFSGWHGVFAPAGTPRAAVLRLSDTITEALKSADLRGRLIALGIEPTGTTPGELEAIMAADRARWAPIVKAAGFREE